jgi:hypothetical protein
MRKTATSNAIIPTELKKQNSCLSCGTTENIKNRKYCSIRCRQKLRQRLNARSGLLQALNTRYATFYFSENIIIMDVVVHGIKEIFRFTRERMNGSKPAEDFSKMTNMLGGAWWEEEKRTGKKYLASRCVLEMAQRQTISSLCSRPSRIIIPTIQKKYLDWLAIDKTQLTSPQLHKIIKNAYRLQAKTHHPDIGGSATGFRKIHDAYKELLHWADDPVFIRRRGFPDKWFYDGANKKWVQPMPHSK